MISRAHVSTNSGARKCPSGRLIGVCAVVAPVANTRRAPSIAANTGICSGGTCWSGESHPRPESPVAKTAAASRRVRACFARMTARLTESVRSGASLPSRENSSCWLSGSGSPVEVAGPSPSTKPRRERGSDGFRAPGTCVTSKLKSAMSSSHRTYILLRCRFVFNHVIAWLSVRKSKSDVHPGGLGALLPRR